MIERGIVRVTRKGSRGTSILYVLNTLTGIAEFFFVGEEAGAPLYTQEDVEDVTEAAATAAMLAAQEATTP